MKAETNLSWLLKTWSLAIPPRPVKSVVEWARKNVRLIGSARSESYDPDITPWTREPIECTANGTRKGTFVKPVQSGGSVTGEIGICYRLAVGAGGDVQYNWPNDDKAIEKWDKRIEKILKACKPVMARSAADGLKWKKGLVVFPHCNLTVQGVFTETNVTSDSIAFQVNEELHDEDGGWFPGRLDQAYGRLTAFWNSTVFNISNAGKKGGQLHQAFEAGTRKFWEVKCPGCGNPHFEANSVWHPMRTRWDDAAPQLGGLRYDADGCRKDGGGYDYFKMQSTVRYQMPCGHIVREDVTQRRALSMSGKYGAPTNPGARPKEESWTLEGVSVDYIPWLDLIEQKHKALRSLKYGDAEPWNTYLRERECRFSSDDTRPTVHRVVLSEKKKDRSGLPNRLARFGTGDYQRGVREHGELAHWWHVIADAVIEPDGRIHVLIVSEGKCLTDEDLIDAFTRHDVQPSCVVLDSGWNAEHVYQLCMKHDYSAIKGQPAALFGGHEGGARKIFSVEKPLHAMLNAPSKYPLKLVRVNKGSNDGEFVPDPREPLFWHYSKSGIRDRFQWIRTNVMAWLEVPADVSKDFHDHLDAESYEEVGKQARTNETLYAWVQHKDRNDLYVCCCYIAMLMEMAGIIGSGVIEDSQPQQNKKEETK